ncbi:ATP-grasp domain-containing protein [Streptomyces chattanoogensis]|uniref:ATP-grasp domain-containing protein n=1 Tax=Streptomyces chattanoogensis TaxID=66876 RepID=UPI00368D374A
MNTGAGPRGPGVLVIEPMGNAGRFLVEAADRLGIRLYAATHKDIYDTYPPWLGSALTGLCTTDLADVPRALEDMEAFCRRHRITGIAACWELLTPLAALLAERLRLPGNDPALARAARNKILMGQAFAAAGVPAPRWKVVQDADQAHQVAASHALGWPLVVKPAEQGGSWGVSIVGGPDQLSAAVAAAQQYTHAQPHGVELDTRVLVQEYVPGEEYSCETVVAHGVAYPLPVVRKETTEGTYRIETGHICPAGLAPPMARRVQHIAARAALAVGIRNGVAHTEVKIRPAASVPEVIETGARLPGDNICEIVEAASGVSAAAAYLQAVLGRVPDTVPLRSDAAAIRFLLPERGGRLGRIVIPEVSGTHSELHLRPGDMVPQPTDSSCRVGHVVARAETVEQARRLAAQVASRSRVEVS